ncbi:MAG: radical SAM protein [Bacteroidota bacterium]
MNEITVKTILNRKKVRDSWFLDDYTLNPFSGCSFNCLFCYIRGSKYGEHMERKMSVKVNAPELLDKQLALRARKRQYGVIVLASATDPYLQLESEVKMTRKLLEIILKYRFPVHLLTRSDLVTRDFDLLQAIDEQAILPDDLKGRLRRGVVITFSFSGMDDQIASIFEPGATRPSIRLETMRITREASFLSGVSMMPLLPYITDTTDHLHLMYEAFRKHNAQYVFPATLTLFGEEPSSSRTLVFRAIKKHYPDLYEKYNKFFSEHIALPAYYRNAFHLKIKELSTHYGIPDNILKVKNQ